MWLSTCCAALARRKRRNAWQERQPPSFAACSCSHRRTRAAREAWRRRPRHTEALARWEQTAHVRAWDCLQGDRRPEHLTCHGEPFCRTGCSQTQPSRPAEGGQCGTCHGDGIFHAPSHGAEKGSRGLACGRCQDAEPDPRSKEQTALGAITPTTTEKESNLQ